MRTPPHELLRIGLTGGIGSGKSTVANMLAEAGAWVIDADALSRESTAAGGAAIAPIAAHFGAEYVDAHGALDRARMRALVFSDPAARARLEAIVHPHVLRAIAEQEQAARQAGVPVAVLDIPLLVESRRWAAQLDAVLVVDCTTETQIERVVRRSAMARPQVEAVLAAQASRAQRRARADAVIFNEGLSLPELAALVAALARTFGL